MNITEILGHSSEDLERMLDTGEAEKLMAPMFIYTRPESALPPKPEKEKKPRVAKEKKEKLESSDKKEVANAALDVLKSLGIKL